MSEENNTDLSIGMTQQKRRHIFSRSVEFSGRSYEQHSAEEQEDLGVT